MVSHIQGSIEVVPQLLNKGVIVKSFMNRLLKKRAGRLPVFAMIIGDEQCDDMMFEVRSALWCGVVWCGVVWCAVLCCIVLYIASHIYNPYFSTSPFLTSFFPFLSLSCRPCSRLSERCPLRLVTRS